MQCPRCIPRERSVNRKQRMLIATEMKGDRSARVNERDEGERCRASRTRCESAADRSDCSRYASAARRIGNKANKERAAAADAGYAANANNDDPEAFHDCIQSRSESTHRLFLGMGVPPVSSRACPEAVHVTTLWLLNSRRFIGSIAPVGFRAVSAS